MASGAPRILCWGGSNHRMSKRSSKRSATIGWRVAQQFFWWKYLLDRRKWHFPGFIARSAPKSYRIHTKFWWNLYIYQIVTFNGKYLPTPLIKNYTWNAFWTNMFFLLTALWGAQAPRAPPPGCATANGLHLLWCYGMFYCGVLYRKYVTI